MLKRLFLAGLILAIAPVAFAQTSASEAAPELPVAEWAGQGPVSLEDFRGQVTVLLFYNDSTA